MSVQISCTICGEFSPRTIDTGPAVEWSRDHRCDTGRLIELAAERRTVSRLGRQTARETDRDLVLMGEMAKRLAEYQADDTASRLSLFLDEVTGSHLSKSTYAVSDMIQATDERYARLRDEAVAEALADLVEPHGEPSDAQVEAAARAILPLLDPTWPYYDFDEVFREPYVGERTSRFRDAVQTALAAAADVVSEKPQWESRDERGFPCTEFQFSDYRGEPPRTFRVAQSSIATECKVWIGVDEHLAHMGIDEAIRVRDALNAFLADAWVPIEEEDES